MGVGGLIEEVVSGKWGGFIIEWWVVVGEW
jgi:hypothetical protein